MAKLGNPLGEGKELWKSIKGYEGLYEVSNQGRIRSVDRLCSRNIVGLENYTKRGRVLKPRHQRQGYVLVALWNKKGERKDILTHRLVAKTFIKNPKEKKTVNHKNGAKDDNRVENLEWATQLENNRHSRESGFFTKDKKGENNPSAKLEERDVRMVKMACEMGLSNKTIAGIFKVSKSAIGLIRTGRNWGHIKLNKV